MNAVSETTAQVIALPDLREGEIYVSGIVMPDCRIRHTILLPDERKKINWNDAMDWAKSIGGVLPDRIELQMLLAFCKEHFKKGWYWSSEQCSANYAWGQHFANGDQYDDFKKFEASARACRRLFL